MGLAQIGGVINILEYLFKVALYLGKLSRGDQGPTKMCGELIKEFCHYVGFP